MKLRGILSVGAILAMLGAAGCSSNVPTDYYYNNNGERLRNSIRDVTTDETYTERYNYDRYNDDILLGRRYPNTLNKVETTRGYVNNRPVPNRMTNNIYRTNVPEVRVTTPNMSNNMYNTTRKIITTPEIRNTTGNVNQNMTAKTKKTTAVPKVQTTAPNMSNNIYNTTKKVTTVPKATFNAPKLSNNITRTMDSVRIPSNVPTNSALSNNVYDRYELRNADFNYVTENGRKVVIENPVYPTTNTLINETITR